MQLAHLTWPEIDALPRDIVVLLPTGATEQHGPHLPLATDTILVTRVAEAVEAALPDRVLLLPTLWLGASQHHLPFAGTLSASSDSYLSTLEALAESLLRHGFSKFFVVNGHGGNTALNEVALRNLKARYPTGLFGHRSYFSAIPEAAWTCLQGRLRTIRHACEAETSLMLHLAPQLVRQDRLRDDGLRSEPPIDGLVFSYDEISEEGSFGEATQATPEKGRILFEAAVEALTRQMHTLADGVRLQAY